MTRPIYRIYLAPDRFGRMQQTPRKTRDYYDIDLNQCKIVPKTRWYRIVQSSPGRVFTALWKAASPEASRLMTISELGAFMQVFSDLWYVDGRDVDLEQALDLNPPSLTKPKVMALSLAVIVFVYLIVMSLLPEGRGQPISAIQPLARITGFSMLFLLVIEQLLNRMKRWLQESRNSR